MGSFRMRLNDSRERVLDNLTEAAGENTRTKAVMRAARYYVRMRGSNTAVGEGTVHELLRQAHEQGSLTAEQIAGVLDAPELSVEYRSEIEIESD